jgi:hypothetical protein
VLLHEDLRLALGLLFSAEAAQRLDASRAAF